MRWKLNSSFKLVDKDFRYNLAFYTGANSWKTSDKRTFLLLQITLKEYLTLLFFAEILYVVVLLMFY